MAPFHGLPHGRRRSTAVSLHAIYLLANSHPHRGKMGWGVCNPASVLAKLVFILLYPIFVFVDFSQAVDSGMVINKTRHIPLTLYSSICVRRLLSRNGDDGKHLPVTGNLYC